MVPAGTPTTLDKVCPNVIMDMAIFSFPFWAKRWATIADTPKKHPWGIPAKKRLKSKKRK